MLGTLPEERFQLLVFSDDWGRHPSSCQHLVRQLLPRFEVVWINTIGTRLPGLNRYSLERATEKILGWLVRKTTARHGNPRVMAPLMWPSFRSPVARSLNRRSMVRTIRRLPPAGRRVALTTLPIIADLVGRVAAERWIYYCVDDLAEWPGLDRPSLQRMETELLRKVDGVVAASPWLVDRMASLGWRATLLTHGVDVEHWAAPGVHDSPAVRALPPPRIIFWGVVDRRLDLGWIRSLSEQMRSGSIILIGPENDPDPGLASCARLHRVGALPYELLPLAAQLASVLIMPYANLAVTRAMQPLKLKEYLATGKPVVARHLPATQEWSDACDLVTSPEAFSEMVLTRLKTELPVAQARARCGLEQESWMQKAQILENALRGEQ